MNRYCPLCHVDNPIIKTKLEREEYTKCRQCGLLYTHAPIAIENFDTYYDMGRDKDHNYQEDYIKDKEHKTRNEALAKQMQLLSDEPWVLKDILEIGSSAGWLLGAAKEMGARIYGVEISFAGVEASLALLGEYYNDKIIKGNWETLDINDMHWQSFFDIIITSHVIEHFVYPVDAIRKIAMSLRLGGCWITQHPDASVYPGVLFHVRDNVPKEHLQIFDADTILIPSQAAGFRRITYIQEEPGQSVSVFRKIKHT
jgi:2-polyprenyl-3-methyl-5-hydroxy-6-metoxy-1,4-benzoquinol methylase